MTITVTEVGRTQDTTAATSKTCAYTGTLAAGRTVVVLIDAPTGSTNTLLTVTDTKGNTYAVQQSVFHNAYAPAVAVGQLTTGVTAADHITVTLAVSSSAWLITAQDIGVVGGVDVSGNVGTDGATHSSASVATGASATVDAQIVFTAFAVSNTTHAATPTGGDTAIGGGVLQVGTGTSARQLYVQYQQYTTGSGSARTSTATLATAGQYAAVTVAINVTGGGGGGGGGGGTYPVEVGRTTSTSAGTSKACTLAAAVPAGHKLAVVVDAPTGSTNTSVTVTDSKSNTYVTEQTVFNATYAPAIALGTIGTSLGTSDSVTVTLAVSSGEWCIVLMDMGPVGAYDVGGSVPTDGSTHSSGSVTTSANATFDRQTGLAAVVTSNTTHVVAGTSGWSLIAGGVCQSDSGTSARQLYVLVQTFTTGSAATRSASFSITTAGQYAALIVMVNTDAKATWAYWNGSAWVDLPSGMFSNGGSGNTWT